MLGRSLWDFVAGADLEKLQRMLVRRVRGEARGVELGFRCDAPGLRREMDIRIHPSASRRLVIFRTSLLHKEQRPPQALLDPRAPRGERTVTMCGWCDRFLVDGRWVEIEEAAKQLDLFLGERMPRINHGVCPECSRQLLAA